ncbi:endonuclease [Nocardia brevicatena]|uniref:endonuclease n=1 Tax=Nocardia brevicatena TaxID=37327 RepID=UPI00031E6836|nr:endonuclease [Nocardia brevicatena]
MNRRDIAHALLDRAGTTYAAEAKIELHDKPAPLFQLLILTDLLSARISADIAIAATAELVGSGYRDARKIADADRQELIDALGRGHYRRYDESTASQLGAIATTALDKYDGDLRKLAEEADHDVERAGELIQQFKGIGPTGGDIFLREVQDVWPWVRPYFDKRAVRGAKRIDLPTDPDELAHLAPGNRTAELAAALVRVGLDDDLAEEVRAAN